MIIAETFAGKMSVVAEASAGAIFGANPPREFRSVREVSKDREESYRSPQAYSNPPLEALETEIIDLALCSYDGGGLDKLPWTDKKFSQGLHLAVMVSFADMHKAPLPKEYFVPEFSEEFVDRVMEVADQKRRQITLSEQFRIALDLSGGNILGAAVIAHAGSRAIARGSDTRFGQRRYKEKDVIKWHNSVANFENITEEYDDPPGENYHFWGTFIAGLLSETGDRTRDKIFNPIYRQIYTKT
ncbi:MAG: hypothetical protein HYT09_03475, partial [Candidatus Levybacteria bacterium]|nr:hypothetical protein [Candidatus Levybacteria bacterium]